MKATRKEKLEAIRDYTLGGMGGLFLALWLTGTLYPFGVITV